MSQKHSAAFWVTRTALGVALVVVAQLLGKVIPAGAVIAGPFSVTQLVTGSLVNCVLFVFTATTGIWSGVAIGILSSVLDPLARANIGIFAVSTFDTDYILVKAQNLRAAIDALEAHGHRRLP